MSGNRAGGEAAMESCLEADHNPGPIRSAGYIEWAIKCFGQLKSRNVSWTVHYR